MSKRVNVRPLLNEHQQKQLGTHEVRVRDACEAECHCECCCDCELGTHTVNAPNPYYVDYDKFNRIKHHDRKRAVRLMFESGQPSMEYGDIVIDMSISLPLLEDDKKPLLEFMNTVGKDPA